MVQRESIQGAVDARVVGRGATLIGGTPLWIESGVHPYYGWGLSGMGGRGGWGGSNGAPPIMRRGRGNGLREAGKTDLRGAARRRGAGRAGRASSRLARLLEADPRKSVVRSRVLAREVQRGAGGGGGQGARGGGRAPVAFGRGGVGVGSAKVDQNGGAGRAHRCEVS